MHGDIHVYEYLRHDRGSLFSISFPVNLPVPPPQAEKNLQSIALTSFYYFSEEAPDKCIKRDIVFFAYPLTTLGVSASNKGLIFIMIAS
jgi:hypothetical protein